MYMVYTWCNLSSEDEKELTKAYRDSGFHKLKHREATYFYTEWMGDVLPHLMQIGRGLFEQ